MESIVTSIIHLQKERKYYNKQLKKKLFVATKTKHEKSVGIFLKGFKKKL